MVNLKKNTQRSLHACTAHLLDLLELVDAEDASRVAAVRADLLAEALGDAAVADRQVRHRQPLVAACGGGGGDGDDEDH